VYSPKIREDLIPRIYRAAKAAGVHMTTWINRVIEERLPEPFEINDDEIIKQRKEKRNRERYGSEERSDSQ
jgi:hypothetical protein